MVCIVLSLEPHRTLDVDLFVMVYLTGTRAGRVRHPNMDISSIKCPICSKFLTAWAFNYFSSFPGGEGKAPWPQSRLPPMRSFLRPPWHLSELIHFATPLFFQ